MTRDVFISYAAEDQAIAQETCMTLEAAGISCWIAPRDVPPGIPYGESIVAGVRDSSALVLIFTAAADASPHVLREVERAVHERMPILTFRVEDTAPTQSMEYFLRPVHWLDAWDPPYQTHLGELPAKVRSLLGRSKSMPPKPAAPGELNGPERKDRGVRMTVVGMVVVALIGAGAIVWAARNRDHSPVVASIEQPDAPTQNVEVKGEGIATVVGGDVQGDLMIGDPKVGEAVKVFADEERQREEAEIVRRKARDEEERKRVEEERIRLAEETAREERQREGERKERELEKARQEARDAEAARLRKQAEEREYRELVREEEDGLDFLTNGDLDVMREAVQSSLETLEGFNRFQGQAKSHLALGIIAQKRGQTDRAREHFEKSRTLYREADMPFMVRRLMERIQGLEGKSAEVGDDVQPSGTESAPPP